MSVKVLHTADLHIDSPLSALKDAAHIRCAELLDIFGKITETAFDENVDILIISGDLFDNPRPSRQAIDYVKRRLASIPHIKVFIALGNHDALLKEAFPDNVYIFGKSIEKIEFDNFDIYGASFGGEYCDTSLIKDFTAENPSKINILALHCDLVGKGQESRYNPVTKEDLSKTCIDYAALGHVHQYSGISTINNVSYAYCGIPEGRGFDEVGPKGVIIGQVYKNKADMKFLPLCRRECIEVDIDITGCRDYDEVCEKIYECTSGENNLFKINLRGELEENLFLDTNFLYERIKDSYFYVKLNDFTVPKIDIDRLSKEHSLKGLFAKELLEQGGSAAALKYGLAALAGEKVSLE